MGDRKVILGLHKGTFMQCLLYRSQCSILGCKNVLRFPFQWRYVCATSLTVRFLTFGVVTPRRTTAGLGVRNIPFLELSPTS
jgi:hypothetical protein